VGQYAQSHIMGGCWVIGVSMYDEGRGIPKWPVRVSAGDCTYSPTLEVDVPDDFELTWYSNGMQVHP
ncbi:hypothetical protein, partial [Enterocloster citroniae]|uniref:hypothetical protein n=1 Tax=Enterocloster citroniae TaxID=358743 RepID=UPI00349EAAC0